MQKAQKFWLLVFWSLYLRDISPVHVVLVTLLVDQLSNLFLPFFGRPNKNLFSLMEFLVRLWFYWSTKFHFGIPKFLFSTPKNQILTKKIQRLTKNSLRLNKYFFGRPKKVKNRPDNWSTKRLTITTWTGLFFPVFFRLAHLALQMTIRLIQKTGLEKKISGILPTNSLSCTNFSEIAMLEIDCSRVNSYQIKKCWYVSVICFTDNSIQIIGTRLCLETVLAMPKWWPSQQKHWTCK